MQIIIYRKNAELWRQLKKKKISCTRYGGARPLPLLTTP